MMGLGYLLASETARSIFDQVRPLHFRRATEGTRTTYLYAVLEYKPLDVWIIHNSDDHTDHWGDSAPLPAGWVIC